LNLAKQRLPKVVTNRLTVAAQNKEVQTLPAALVQLDRVMAAELLESGLALAEDRDLGLAAEPV
jgi:hypothetical protein